MRLTGLCLTLRVGVVLTGSLSAYSLCFHVSILVVQPQKPSSFQLGGLANRPFIAFIMAFLMDAGVCPYRLTVKLSRVKPLQGSTMIL